MIKDSWKPTWEYQSATHIPNLYLEDQVRREHCHARLFCSKLRRRSLGMRLPYTVNRTVAVAGLSYQLVAVSSVFVLPEPWDGVPGLE